jgi:KDO2-lipid IV(A) lauroyltransferase
VSAKFRAFFSTQATRAGIAFMRLLAHFPLPLVRGLGAVLGWVLYGVAVPRRRVVQVNLALCFPERSAAERRSLARQTFVYFAQTWLDRSWLWHGRPEVLARRLHLHGALNEFEGHAPTIVFSPHFYGLDAGATAINMAIDRDFTSIYSEQSNPLLDQWIKAGRLRFGRVRLFLRREGVKGNVNALRSGEVLYLLPDMDFSFEGTVFVPFFGVPTATVPSIPRFARLGRAKVISVVPRLTASGYDVEVMPAWPNYPSGDLEADTALVNQHLERFINTMPAQYYWVHKRFKSRPAGLPPVY